MFLVRHDCNEVTTYTRTVTIQLAECAVVAANYIVAPSEHASGAPECGALGNDVSRVVAFHCPQHLKREINQK